MSPLGKWLRRRAARRRNRELDEWGASIPVTDAQQEAMKKLWEASQKNEPPSEDPLLALSAADREYLIQICSADFRPARFGDANVLRTATFLHLVEQGFSHEQAAIVIGMIFNSVGPGGREIEKILSTSRSRNLEKRFPQLGANQ